MCIPLGTLPQILPPQQITIDLEAEDSSIMGKVIDKFVHWFNHTAIPWHTSLGVTKGTVTLEVPGRKTGKPARVSLTTVRYNRSRDLVSLYDKSQCVKNVRAADDQATIVSGRRTPVRLAEVPQGERAPILLGYVQQRAFSHSGEESAKLVFGLGQRPTLREMEVIANNYVVFGIQSLPE